MEAQVPQELKHAVRQQPREAHELKRAAREETVEMGGQDAHVDEVVALREALIESDAEIGRLQESEATLRAAVGKRGAEGARVLARAEAAEMRRELLVPVLTVVEEGTVAALRQRA